jgi:NAD(P)H-flavin reductase
MQRADLAETDQAIRAADEVPYRVSAIERRTPVIVEVRLHPLAKPLGYLPGEFVLLEDRARRVPPRSYSIANAPLRTGRSPSWSHAFPKGRPALGSTIACRPETM